MPTFTVQAPNGKSYTVEGATAQGAQQAVAKMLGDSADLKTPTGEARPNFDDTEAASNQEIKRQVFDNPALELSATSGGTKKRFLRTREGLPAKANRPQDVAAALAAGPVAGLTGGAWTDEAIGAYNTGNDMLEGRVPIPGNTLWEKAKNFPGAVAENFDKNREWGEKYAQELSEDQPAAYYGSATGAVLGSLYALPQLAIAEGVGAVPSAAAAARLGPAAARGIAARGAMIDGIGNGALYGGVTGLGEGTGTDRLWNAGKGTAIGAGVGAVAGKIGSALSREAPAPAAGIAGSGLADEANALGQRFGVRSLTTGMKTQNPTIRAEEELMRQSEGPAREVMQGSHERLFGNAAKQEPGEINQAIDNLAGELGNGEKVNATEAGDRLSKLAGASQREHAFNSGLEDAVDHGLATRRGDELSQRLGPGESALDAAEGTANALRERASAHKDRTNTLYDEARATPGEWSPNALVDMHDNILQAIAERNRGAASRVVISQDSTPNAQAALNHLQQQSQFTRPLNAAAPRPVTGHSNEEVENIRQYLNDMWGKAVGSDRRAIGEIKTQFDQHLINAARRGDYSGDADALIQRLQAARASHADYQTTFRPSGEDMRDPKRFLKKVIEGDAKPDEVQKALFAHANMGNTAQAARNALHLRGVLGDKSQEWARLKAAQWADLRNAAGGITRENAQQVASRIEEFVNGKGRALAAVYYGPEERAAMTAWARELRGFGQRSSTTPEHIAALAKIGDGKMAPEELIKTALSGGKDGHRLIRAFKAVHGEEAMGLLRQAHLRKVIGAADGSSAKGAGTIANALRKEMMNRSLMRELYTPGQQDSLEKFARLMDFIKTQPGTLNTSGSAGPINDATRKMAFSVARSLASKFGLGFFITGHPVAGAMIEFLGEAGHAAIQAARHAQQAKKATTYAAGEMPSPDLSDLIGHATAAGLNTVSRGAKRGTALAGPAAGYETQP
jgi:hypothetical protein